MLTTVQRRALVVIAERLEATGVAPTVRELAVLLGLKSPAPVQRTLDCLVERGFLRRLPNRWRGLEVVRRPLGPWPSQRVRCFRFDDEAKVLVELPARTGKAA